MALLASSAVATAVKATTIPGLLLLALAFFARLKGRTLLIAVGATAGLAVNAIGLRWLGPRSVIEYGGIGDLSSLHLIAERLPRTGPHLALWLAFVGVSLAVVAVASPRRVFQDRALRVLAPGSLAAVFLFQFVSTYDFARYCYPAMWVALLWVLLTADVRKRSLVAALLAVELAMAAPLFMRSTDRFRFWPELVKREMINSSGTMFPGTRIYGLTARQLLRDSKPCVWINSENGERNELLKQFARPMFPTSKIHVSPAFDPDHDPACTWSTTIRMWREHVESPAVGCAASCGPCEFQKMEYLLPQARLGQKPGVLAARPRFAGPDPRETHAAPDNRREDLDDHAIEGRAELPREIVGRQDVDQDVGGDERPGTREAEHRAGRHRTPDSCRQNEHRQNRQHADVTCPAEPEFLADRGATISMRWTSRRFESTWPIDCARTMSLGGAKNSLNTTSAARIGAAPANKSAMRARPCHRLDR